MQAVRELEDELKILDASVMEDLEVLVMFSSRRGKKRYSAHYYFNQRGKCKGRTCTYFSAGKPIRLQKRIEEILAEG